MSLPMFLGSGAGAASSLAFLAKKNIKFYFPATTEQNIARVIFFRKPSDYSFNTSPLVSQF
jgi:hypothetical protein